MSRAPRDFIFHYKGQPGISVNRAVRHVMKRPDRSNMKMEDDRMHCLKKAIALDTFL